MRVNFVSLFCAVFTSILAFFVIIDLVKICFGEKAGGDSYLSATLAVFILGFGSSFWWMATTSELYTLNCFFIILFFFISLKWYQGREIKFLLLASFILGISSAVYGADLLFLPACFVSYLIARDEDKLAKLLLLVFFFLLGYSIYFYLPVRSLVNPPFDWGNPETFKRFFIHITDQKDTDTHFNAVKSLLFLFNNVFRFTLITVSELTLIGLVLACTGLICHFKKHKESCFLFSSIVTINTLFFLTDNSSHLFLVSFLIFSIWAGLGIYLLAVESSGYIFKFRYINLIIPLVIVFVIFSVAKDFTRNNKSSYYLPKDHAREMYVNLEQNAIIFSYMYNFHFRYLKDIEFLRPDITIINLSDLARPDLFDQVNQKRFNMIDFPSVESKRENQHEFIQMLISKNVNKRPIYWDFKKDLTKYNYQYLVPGVKFLMRFVGHKVDKIPEDLLKKYLINLQESMLREINNDHFFIDHRVGVRGYYYNYLTNFVDYLIMKKMYHHALPFLDLALSITISDNEAILNLKAVCFMKSGNIDQAEKIFIKLYNKNKDDYAYNFNLASLYFGKMELNKSKLFVKKTIELNEDFIKARVLLGQIYSEEGEYEKAVKEITYAIDRTEFTPEKKKMQNLLERVNILRTEKNFQKTF